MVEDLWWEEHKEGIVLDSHNSFIIISVNNHIVRTPQSRIHCNEQKFSSIGLQKTFVDLPCEISFNKAMCLCHFHYHEECLMPSH